MPLCHDEFNDLAVEWPMILVGWRGFARRKLSAEEVVASALSRIGRGTDEQDEITALLANTDPGEWQTIDRYLERLAGGDEFDKELALRRWRLAELNHLIKSLNPSDGPVDEEECDSVNYALQDFWLTYNEVLDDGADVRPEYGTSILQMLADQQAWVDREKTALHDTPEKRP